MYDNSESGFTHYLADRIDCEYCPYGYDLCDDGYYSCSRGGGYCYEELREFFFHEVAGDPDWNSDRKF